MSDTIEVIRITPVNGQGNLRGFADVRVGAVTICDCRIVQEPSKAAHVRGPQKKVNGGWLPLVKMTPELRERVQAAVLVQWRQEAGR